MGYDFKNLKSDTPNSDTKFNSALAKLERINKIRNRIYNNKINGDNISYLTELENWRTEIGYKFMDSENNESNKFENKLYQLIDSEMFWTTGLKYERHLQNLEQKYGFGMPDKESAEDAALI